MSILAEIQRLAHEVDVDSAFLTAAAINLYNEAMRRKGLKILYRPRDAENLLAICTMLLTAGQDGMEQYQEPARATEPTPEELDQILTTEIERRA